MTGCEELYVWPGSVPRYFTRPFAQRTACTLPSAVSLYPTASERLLISSAQLKLPPGNTPRSVTTGAAALDAPAVPASASSATQTPMSLLRWDRRSRVLTSRGLTPSLTAIQVLLEPCASVDRV